MNKEEFLKSMRNTAFVSHIDEPAPEKAKQDFSFIQRVWVNSQGGISASWQTKDGKYVCQTWRRRFHVDRSDDRSDDGESDGYRAGGAMSLEMERPFILTGMDVSELIADAKRRGIFEK